jgi:aerobic-type carbon monoxide dehydrogenase small subunit (CoxS/CutS family)
METTTIKLRINGQERSVTTPPERPLLEVLREDLGLTGTKFGCGEGQCGACSVLVDGKRVFSCRTDVESASGKTVTTIEGLAKGDALHPVQEAFLAESASQCGYCTPGMIMAAVALLNDKPHASDDEIVRGMNANVCRCCNYVNILSAVKRAAGRPAGEPAAAQAEGRARP